jgi:predicted RNA-binding Zn-ribbon protein involved in translation (DUF1610 family)
MTTVRAQCPACGDVQLQIDDLTVRVCNDNETSSTYRFACPGCEQTVHREASPRIVDLLLSAGAPHELWSWPAELAEPRSGPPLTPDDLLDLHVLLEDDTWFQQLVALVRRTTPE